MELETPNNDNNGETSNSTTPDLRTPNNGETFNSEEPHSFSEDIDSTCSTPYVSAPSSPGRGHTTGFFYSAPASPMHFVLSSTPSISAYTASSSDGSGSFEFEFSGRLASNGLAVAGSMSSADELFLNGQIRPMKLSTHLQRPQVLAPLLDLDVEDEYDVDKDSDQLGLVRGRDLRMRDRSLRRRTRSLSPLRNAAFQINRGGGGGGVIECEDQDDESNNNNNNDNDKQTETTPSVSASSSRSSSAGRSSKRWVFLKEFLYRSKSEGRSSNHHKFWSSISFSPAKDKKIITTTSSATSSKTTISEATTSSKTLSSSIEKKAVGGRASNGVGKRRVPPSPHELHYTANRAQAEEMKKKTFLPYRQGLLGCLGFSSKSYGAMNGFARALNPVSSR